MRKMILLLIWISFFLSGCYTKTTIPGDVTPSKQVGTYPEGEGKESNGRTPNPTVLSPTRMKVIGTTSALKTESPTSNIPAYPTITKQEMEVNGPIPLCSGEGSFQKAGIDFGVPGTIILQKENAVGLYTIAGTPMKIGRLPVPDNEPLHVFGISPNGKWLAYSPIDQKQDKESLFENPTIVLIGSDGKRIEQSLDFNWLKDFQVSGYNLEKFVWGYWLNDHAIYSLVNSKLPDDRLQVGRYYPVILDPFRGEWLSKEINFLPGLDGFSGYALSPDMNSVIHDYDGISYLEKTDSTITQLWTDENAHLPSLSSVQWSPDSAWAVFASQDLTTKNAVHLLLVSRDNKVVKEIRNPRIGNFFNIFIGLLTAGFSLLYHQRVVTYIIFLFLIHPKINSLSNVR